MLRLRPREQRYDRTVSRAVALVDEIAGELDTWPGVRIEQRAAAELVVLYEKVELGVLDRERGVAELRFSAGERDALVEHGDAEPAEPIYRGENVTHNLHGPADVTAVLELFDRRYRDVRGEDDPFSSRDSG
jgi:Luciferase